MTKIRAGVIKGKGIKTSTTWTEGMVIHEHGIEASTVENIDPPFTMSHAVKTPGPHTAIRTRAHYHLNNARALYILKGHMRVFFGPEGKEQVFDVEPGDYIYCPKGEIHSEVNLDPTETVEWVTTYVGVRSREESERVFTEPPRGKK